MAEVNVEINGRKYRMACEDGEEDHLRGLAERFNGHIDGFKGTFGEIGDNRLTVMAGIAVLDELAEAERKIEDLRGQIDNMLASGQTMAAASSDLEARFTKRMAEVARKIEAVATAIDETARSGG